MKMNAYQIIKTSNLPSEAYVIINDSQPEKALIMGDCNDFAKGFNTVMIHFTITSLGQTYEISGIFTEVPVEKVFFSHKDACNAYESMNYQKRKSHNNYQNQLHLCCCANCVNSFYNKKFDSLFCQNNFPIESTGVCGGFKLKVEVKK